jgi:predicted dehydrogenase
MEAGVFKVLIIGCGNIAGGFDAARSDNATALTHAGAYGRHPGFQLAACVDPDHRRRKTFMARWGVGSGAGTLEQLSSAPGQFDVISICSPTAFHSDHLEAALDLAPRLIFCEKPVTTDTATTRRFVEACAARDVRLVVNHTRRWDPAIVTLRQELQGGRWGHLRAISGTYNKGVLNNGAHLIDLVQYLVGPVHAIAAGPAVFDFWPDDPTVPALLEVQGIPFHLCTSHAGDYANFEMTLTTSEGVVVMENGGMSWRIRVPQQSSDFPGYRSLGPATTRSGSYAEAMGAAIENIHAALTENAPLSSTGTTALAAQNVCEAIRNLAKSPASP